MYFQIDDNTRRRARAPHELAMINLLLINLLMLIALLAGSFLQPGSWLAQYKLIGVLIPLLMSLGIIGYSLTKPAKLGAGGAWYAATHWRLANGRYKILLIAYGVGLALIALGWLLSHTQSDPRMQELMFIALQRVAIAPILIALMAIIMLESGALSQAGRGELPDRLVQRFPPPADLLGSESEFQSR